MPNVRVDRNYMNDLELYVLEYVVMQLAEMVNELTRAGAIYGQLILPPEQAAAKRAAMNGRANA